MTCAYFSSFLHSLTYSSPVHCFGEISEAWIRTHRSWTLSPCHHYIDQPLFPLEPRGLGFLPAIYIYTRRHRPIQRSIWSSTLIPSDFSAKMGAGKGIDIQFTFHTVPSQPNTMYKSFHWGLTFHQIFHSTGRLWNIATSSICHPRCQWRSSGSVLLICILSLRRELG